MGWQDFAQAASNEAAGAVSAPVDLLAWLLKKAGVPVGEAVGGSDWMQRQGLTRPVQQSPASLAGQTVGLLSPMVAAAKAPQIAKGLLQMGDNLAAPTERGLLSNQRGAIVYHGSPHKFDKFDSSKIGTGEGAQAYGHGLYLAESPDVAKGYRAKLSAPLPGELWLDGAPFPKPEISFSNPDPKQQQLARIRTLLVQENGNIDRAIVRTYGDDVSALESLRGRVETTPPGSLYKVDLPDEKIARMLDWDKPLSQQAPEVQKAVESVMAKRAAEAEAQRIAMNAQYPGRTTHPLLSKIANKPKTAFDYKGEAAVSQLVQELGGPDKAASYLKQQGIPGIRYLDGGSRGAGAGTSNFVVFPGEEDALKILERNGQRF